MIRAAGSLLVAALFAATAGAAQPDSPLHHAAEIRIDPDARSLTVVDAVSVRGRKAFRFRLAPWIEVERISVDGRPARPDTRRITLPDEGSHRIELRLRGTLPPLRDGRGGAMGRPAAIGAGGGYLTERAGWLPDTDDEWVSYRLGVEIPAPYRAVGTGRLGDEEVGAASYRATFAAQYPAAPPALFFGPYQVRERQADGVRIRTYFHREQAGLSNVYLRDSARYLARYRDRIGPYPYRDFHVISAPVPVGLGYPNLTYIFRRILPLPFIRSRSLAHEVLHNWWGNGVAVDYARGNWSEGLTTYMADHALAAEGDAELGREMRLGWLRDYAALPAGRDVPVTRFVYKRDDAAQVVGYNKVAFIFHMLKQEVGEASFAAALRLFWRQQKFRIAGWTDMRRAFEEASGRDLGWFFDQWLDRAGAPRLELGRVEVKAGVRPGAQLLRFTVKQDSPAYRVTLPVAVEAGASRQRQRIKVEGKETTLTLVLDAPPTALHLDPEHDLFRRLLAGEAPPILRDVTLAAGATAVIASKDEATNKAAVRLARRLLRGGPRLAPAGAAPPSGPLLIVGAAPEVAAYLARAGLAGVPEGLVGRGTARAWTARRAGGHPVLAVSADDARALEALLRPLPHYRGKSYIVFDGRRAIESGVWRPATSPLRWELGGDAMKPP